MEVMERKVIEVRMAHDEGLPCWCVECDEVRLAEEAERLVWK